MDKTYEDYMEQNNDTAPESVQKAYKDVRKALDDCIDVISAYKFNCGYNLAKKEITDNEWIPVGQCLPERAGQEVLATLVNKFGQYRVAEVFTGYGECDTWICNQKEIDIGVWEVIAWMPVPEPYKPEVDADA